MPTEVGRRRPSIAGSTTASAVGSWILGSSNTAASVLFIIAKKSSAFNCVIQAAKSKPLSRENVTPVLSLRYAKRGTGGVCNHRDLRVSQRRGYRTIYFYSLQYSIFDVQLPVATCCQTSVVRHDKQRLVPIACQI